MMLILALAAAAPSYYLVARWPDAPRSNYTRAYLTLAGCQRAKAAIMAAHAERLRAQKAADGGALVNRNIPPPIVVCVPQ